MAGTRFATQVSSRAEFAQFISVLRQPERRPVLVVTVAEGAVGPAIDIAALEDELGDSVHLFVLPAAVTYWLTDALQSKLLSVHSGWARIYPATPAWLSDPGLAPSFAPTPSHPARVLEALVTAALNIAFRGGYLPLPPVPATGEHANVRVRSVVSATQAMVEDDRGRKAVLRAHHLRPGVAAERLVAPGQCFEGTLTPLGLLGEFVPERVKDDPRARFAELVGDGTVVLAVASSVTERAAVLLAHPDIALYIASGRGEDLTTQVTEGEVVAIEVVIVDGETVTSFSDATPAPSMSVLPGGPPWLLPEAKLVPPAPPVAQLAVAERAEASVGAGAADWLLAEVERLEEALHAEEDRSRELRKQVRRGRQLTVPVVYADPERQFGFELELSYLTHVEESRRAQLPWPPHFRLGPELIRSVDDLVAAGGIQRRKVVQVCAEVICGLAHEIPARAVKEWRASRMGPQLRRSDGAVAMRVRLQSSTSAARRLRYWKLTNGEIELDLVCTHDDGLH